MPRQYSGPAVYEDRQPALPVSPASARRWSCYTGCPHNRDGCSPNTVPCFLCSVNVQFISCSNDIGLIISLMLVSSCYSGPARLPAGRLLRWPASAFLLSRGRTGFGYSLFLLGVRLVFGQNQVQNYSKDSCQHHRRRSKCIVDNRLEAFQAHAHIQSAVNTFCHLIQAALI